MATSILQRRFGGVALSPVSQFVNFSKVSKMEQRRNGGGSRVDRSPLSNWHPPVTESVFLPMALRESKRAACESQADL